MIASFSKDSSTASFSHGSSISLSSVLKMLKSLNKEAGVFFFFCSPSFYFRRDIANFLYFKSQILNLATEVEEKRLEE